jgi:TonB family protein
MIPSASLSRRRHNQVSGLFLALATVCTQALALQDDAPRPAPAPAASQAAAASAPAGRTCAPPEWPKEAKQAGQQGKLTLSFLVGVDGTVRDTKVITSTGHPLLDTAGQEAIRRCVFKPTLVDGNPKESWLKMQYVWGFDAQNPPPRP